MASEVAGKRSTRKKIVKIALISSLLLMGVVGYRIYWAFFDLNRLPTGEYLTEETSPDGTYTLKAYVWRPSLSADAVRGELVLNRSGKTKTIYWNYRESAARIEWMNDQTVIINGQTLEVPREKYDWRHE